FSQEIWALSATLRLRSHHWPLWSPNSADGSDAVFPKTLCPDWIVGALAIVVPPPADAALESNGHARPVVRSRTIARKRSEGRSFTDATSTLLAEHLQPNAQYSHRRRFGTDP